MMNKNTNQLFCEMQVLKQLQGGIGIPKFFWFGEEGERYVIVMELLGPNLEYQKVICKNNFSLSTTLHLTDQMVNYFHGSYHA